MLESTHALLQSHEQAGRTLPSSKVFSLPWTLIRARGVVTLCSKERQHKKQEVSALSEIQYQACNNQEHNPKTKMKLPDLPFSCVL